MARARNIGNVYAELSVKDRMSHGLKKAESSLASFGKKIAKIGAGFAVALPTAAFAGLTASMKSAVEAGSKLSDMMARTGADGEGLFLMQRAFENAGLAGDKVPGVLNKMQKALAGVNEKGKRLQTRVFSDLGLSIEKLRSMDAGAAFRKISTAIAAVPDPAQRAALAMEIFGRSGGELLVLMNDGQAFEVAAKQVGGLGKTLANNAEKLDKVADAMTQFGLKAKQVGAEVAVELLPHLEKFADWLSELDLSEKTRDLIDMGKSMGTLAEKTADFVKQSSIGMRLGILGQGLSIGWDNAKRAADALLPIEKQTPTMVEPFAADDYYRDKIMLPPEWETTTRAIAELPEILKRRPDLVEGMRLEDAGIPGLAGIMDAIVESVTPREAMQEKRREIADIGEAQLDVNDMQRRGLGMGGETVAKEAQKQVSLLQEIRDVLKRASTDGSLNWT
jgi:hypothetical protein